MWSAALARAIPFEAGALSKADTSDFSLQPAGDQPSLDFERSTMRCNQAGKYNKKACCTKFLVPGFALASPKVCEEKKFVADAKGNCHQFFYYNSACAAPPPPPPPPSPPLPPDHIARGAGKSNKLQACRNPSRKWNKWSLRANKKTCRSTAKTSTFICARAPRALHIELLQAIKEDKQANAASNAVITPSLKDKLLSPLYNPDGYSGPLGCAGPTPCRARPAHITPPPPSRAQV